jgi:uncharacterized membrane protein YbhN (UPF0104 family)
VNRLDPRTKRWLISAVKLLIVITVLAFIAQSIRAAQAALSESERFPLRALDVRWLLAAGGAYFLGLLPSCGYWHYLNRAMGQQASPYSTMRAYFAGHLGKYVPGKAMAVVLRAALLRGPRVDPAVITVSVFIETFTMMAVAATLAAAIIAWQFAEQGLLLLVAVGLTIAAGVPTWPPVIRFLVRILRITTWRKEIETALAGYTWKVMLVGWISETLGAAMFGISLWCVLRAMPLSTPLDGPFALWPRLAASVSLSMVAGFLSLLPGGMGVREYVLIQLLQDPFGQLVASISSVVLRLVWLLTEVAVSGILNLGQLWRRSS